MKEDYRFFKGVFSVILLCCTLLISTSTSFGQYNKKGIAPVLVPAGGFHVDGDAYANTPVAGVGDWFEKPGAGGWIINADGSYTVPVGDGEMTQFYVDVFKDIDPTAFPGTNKINDAPSTYTVGLANVPSKNDMQRAAAHFSFADPLLSGGIEGDLWCLFAADRWVTNGESYIDFEFNQAKMELVGGAIKSYAPEFDADGDPTKGRTPGDILITIFFEKGGKQATLYVDKWEKSGKGTTYLWTSKNVETDFPPNTLFCTENTEVTLAPWPVYDTGGNTYEINQFAEGAINLTRLMAVGETKCGHLSTVWIRTKTSQSSTAELKDLAGPPFQVDLGVPELMAKCPEDPNLPACMSLADINTAFDAWIAGFTYEGGVEPIEVLSGIFPALPSDVDCKGAKLTYTYKIKDYCEQTAECTATFTVAPDVLAPVLPKLPEGGDLGCNPTPPICATGLVAIDDCDGEVQVTCIAGPITGDDCAKQQTFTYTAEDHCGNSASATVTYKWRIDNTPPVLSDVPGDKDLGCNPAALPVCDLNVSAEDNCDGEVDVTCDPGEVTGDDCAKQQIFTYWAVDFCGNKSSKTVTYKWRIDTTPPAITDLPMGGDLGCNPEKLPTCDEGVVATDNCDGKVKVNCEAGEITGDDCAKQQIFTYWAVDFCDNKSSKTVTYTWTEDLEKPVADCPDPRDLGINPPAGSWAPGTLDWTDNCEIKDKGVIKGIPVADKCSWKVVHVHWAVDECGNYAECNEIITWSVELECYTVVDKVPEFGGDYGQATVWVTIDGTPADPGDFTYKWFPSGETTQTTYLLTTNGAQVTVTDQYGCETECGVQQQQGPECPEPFNLGCNPEELPDAGMIEKDLEDHYGVNITITEISHGEVMGDDCWKWQVWTVAFEDDKGNPAVCELIYKWKEDLTGPVMEPIGDLVFACEEPVVVPTPVFNDDCDGVITDYTCEVVGHPDVDCATFEFPEGESTICFTATDECGNTTIECIKITVEPCVINCQTAYGRLEDGEGESMGTCFIPKFDNWGWTNLIMEEGEYVLPLYAGAAHCDPSNGWGQVGKVLVHYDMAAIMVEYIIDPGYSMSEVHVYVGCGMFPTLKSGRETIAPGQYTHNVMLDKAVEYSVIFNVVQGPVWIIAHAVVCDVSGKQEIAGETYMKTIDCRPKSASLTGIDAIELRVYPNPFDSRVNFEFVSNRDANARLEIFNITGQKLATLMDRIVEEGAFNRVEYQPEAAPGVLFYRLTLGDSILNGKLIYNRNR